MHLLILYKVNWEDYININCKLGIFRYLLKTIMSKHDTLVYKMYQITYRNCENAISLNGWRIKYLLFSLGLSFVWYVQGVVNYLNIY